MDWSKIKPALNEKLDPKVVKDPPPGKYGNYVEGFYVIDTANQVFGHGGWSYEVVMLECVWQGPRQNSKGQERVAADYIAKVRVSVVEPEMGVTPVIREGLGAGSGMDHTMGMAHESAIKEAETDALKRALRSFGWRFGLALYDKAKEHVAPPPPPEVPEKIRLRVGVIIREINGRQTIADLRDYYGGIEQEVRDLGINGFVDQAREIIAAKDKRKAELSNQEQEARQ